ncbi:xanthine dehydrogenase family protein subunit M [Ferrovibrio sp.]|uniref:FAD binding domain-containing protein n=1 Tax=Ferrovibrio sp. TaxID=1917215 RepID=UPI0025BF99BC|nr:xanthine dehydrogenase family protein subunit M [Ferrovibrio sp.]MBX3454686.1 xanthine dehydrogenase family protein subunit M [Ferrovibrio sp.]
MNFQLHKAASLPDAIALSRRLAPDVRYIAGGTDLIIQLRRGVKSFGNLIDLSGLKSLRQIAETAEGYRIGALCTHKDIDLHSGLLRDYPALGQAARVVGGHQVRNAGTIGGNLANASPAADVAVALLGLDAVIVAAGEGGSRHIAIADFFTGPGQSLLAPGELIEAVLLPKPAPGESCCFLKAGRRKAMEIAVVSVALRLRLDNAGAIADIRIALGAVGPRPLRALGTEAMLLGRKPDAALIAKAAVAIQADCTPRSDVRASAEYRRELVGGMLLRALQHCLKAEIPHA